MVINIQRKEDDKNIGAWFSVSGTISWDELKDIYAKELERYAKTVKIEGFRPGKVPLDIVEKRYGEEIKANSIREKIWEALEEETKKKNHWIKIYKIESLVWSQKGDNIEFSLSCEVLPRKKISLDVDLKKPDNFDAKVSDEDIKEEIEILKKRYTTIVDDPEQSELTENSSGVFDIFAKDIATARTYINQKDVFVDLTSAYEWFKKLVVGMKVGETREGIAYVDRGDKKFRITLKSIKKKVIPSEDDLVKTLGYKSKEEFYEEIKKRIEERKKAELKNILYFTLIFNISQKNNLPIPQSLFQQKARQILDDNPNIDKEKLATSATTLALEDIVLYNLIEDMQLKLSEEEIRQNLKEISTQYRLTEEEVNRLFESKKEELEDSFLLKKAREKLMEIVESKMAELIK
ncbi:MAG: trigger factor [Candidatus Calescibacterium sp.]|jgi:trigger factor|nr:trigger factor [Candidatus Calescibacterium sp.]